MFLYWIGIFILQYTQIRQYHLLVMDKEQNDNFCTQVLRCIIWLTNTREMYKIWSSNIWISGESFKARIYRAKNSANLQTKIFKIRTLLLQLIYPDPDPTGMVCVIFAIAGLKKFNLIIFAVDLLPNEEIETFEKIISRFIWHPGKKQDKYREPGQLGIILMKQVISIPTLFFQ